MKSPFLFLSLTMFMTLVSCGFSKQTGGAESPTKQSAPEVRSTFDVNKYPVTKTVCDPWGETPPEQDNGGLKATLYYLNPGQTLYTKVQDYIEYGHKSDQNLFFSALNVPTRKFELGFTSEHGDVVKDDAQNTLIEWFALRFKTVLRLAPEQEEGLYQIAVLSDDGFNMRIRGDDGTYRTLISNDDVHPTKMGCAVETIEFKRNTEIVTEMDYFQGPRYHISLVLMMRKAPADLQQDPLCNHLGNSLFFDYNNNSEPKQGYKDLLARGWAPLGKANYALAEEALFNPCVEGEIPKISNFKLAEASSNMVWLKWTTDIPATSQIIYTDTAAGNTLVTTADNVLRTQHSVLVQGLKPATHYTVQAVSISDSLGKGFSSIISITTEP